MYAAQDMVKRAYSRFPTQVTLWTAITPLYTLLFFDSSTLQQLEHPLLYKTAVALLAAFGLHLANTLFHIYLMMPLGAARAVARIPSL